MKKYLCILLISVCAISCSNTKSLTKHTTNAHIEFKNGSHDFGEIIFGQPAEYDFVFTNTGSDTLIISEVQSTCGCTVPEWSKNPVAPNEKGSVKVKYDTRRSGDIEKGVTVFSNADNGAVLLVITGKVTSNPNKTILGATKQNNQVETDTIQKNQEQNADVK